MLHSADDPGQARLLLLLWLLRLMVVRAEAVRGRALAAPGEAHKLVTEAGRSSEGSGAALTVKVGLEGIGEGVQAAGGSRK